MWAAYPVLLMIKKSLDCGNETQFKEFILVNSKDFFMSLSVRIIKEDVKWLNPVFTPLGALPKMV